MGSQVLLPISQIKVDLDEIQGDVLIGLQKRAEIFVFFTISDVAKFRTGLENALSHISFLRETAIYEAAKPGTPGKQKVVKANIAFSHPGLKKLGITDFQGVDPSFAAGARASAAKLGDDPAGKWLPAYRTLDFHGVLLVAAWDKVVKTAMTKARAEATAILALFGTGLLEVHREETKVRDRTIGGKRQIGHEHFGFADGVSQPGVLGLTKPGAASDEGFPGQDLVEPGDFVIGLESESGPPPATAPWMKNGSYMVVRRLRQDVGGFFSYAAQSWNGIAASEDQFTARLVGRWKDGSPVVRNPAHANPQEDEDHPQTNNDFEFGPDPDGDPAQADCPFQSHIRRVYPRADLKNDEAEKRRILRAGIAYGEDEDADKGLFFVCYQNSIVDKFEFIQQFWANNALFPNPVHEAGMTVPPRPGIDLIIGQGGEVRDGTWANGKKVPPQPRQFVTSTGAAYFLSPSRTTLKAIAAG